MDYETIVWVNIALLTVNFALICLIYTQVRHLYKPIITIKVIHREKDVEARPSVLEFEDLYLVISNVSKNPARKLKIQYKFLLENRKPIAVNKTLSYLNPGEATREPLEYGKIIKEHPDLFQTETRGDETKKIPKKTLKLLLDVMVTYNLPRYKLLDSYEVHWESLESLPDFEHHPSILCWNKRDGIYIYKRSE